MHNRPLRASAPVSTPRGWFAQNDDERVVFRDDEADEQDGESGGKGSPAPWRILIADDDEEVHRATAFALRGVKIDGAPLELLHASSAAEAAALLARETDIAVAMLDVVMESTDAGLRLVETIRNELGLSSLRIILRTGQPGYAPELEVIQRCDINDYRTKSELTQVRLITTLTSAVRAYAQLEQIARAGAGMREVAKSSNELFRIRGVEEFCARLLERIGNLIGDPESGMVCATPPELSGKEANARGLVVLGAVGPCRGLLGLPIEKLVDVPLQQLISRCVAIQGMVFEERRCALWIGNPSREAVVVFESARLSDPLERQLIEVLAANLAVGFENVDLFERLDFFAFFDPLTRLPNRTRFLSEVDQDLFSSAGSTRCLAIADIVRFSDFNDALGHRCGDTLLAGVARRLRATVGAEVRCARISADVFAMFGPEAAIDPTSIRRAFESPFFVHGHALTVGIRLGLVRVADSRGSAMDLIRNANLALNEARNSSGAGYAWFSRGLSEDVQSRVALLHNLRAAIDFKRGLSLAFQPQVDARSGALLGCEALLRWRNDYGEMISPATFIPLAERTGMIGELGLWVIERALDQLVRLRALGQDVTMSVNVSSVQFRADDFAVRVKKLIALCDVPADRVVLEITESIALEDRALVMTQIEDLRAIGVRFSIDDFGTGFSSLSQLARLPADQLKIDRSFVEYIDGSDSDRALASAVVMLARARGLTVVAEGVETDGQRAALIELGCDKMQGYHFARPMAADQLERWLRERGTASH